MSRIFHVWWLVIVAIIVIALILIWALYSGSQSLSANSLYDAVNSSVMYAREKGSRMDRGTFVINRELFQQRLAEYKIKGYGRVGDKAVKPNQLYIHYLPDSKRTDNNSIGYTINKNGTSHIIRPKVTHGYISSQNYKEDMPQDDLPIRGVQVSANSVNHHQDHGNKISDTKGKYVATDIVQVADQDKDTSNNTPIRDPNKTTRNSDDPTVNSFRGTNGSYRTLDASD